MDYLANIQGSLSLINDLAIFGWQKTLIVVSVVGICIFLALGIFERGKPSFVENVALKSLTIITTGAALYLAVQSDLFAGFATIVLILAASLAIRKRKDALSLLLNFGIISVLAVCLVGTFSVLSVNSGIIEKSSGVDLPVDFASTARINSDAPDLMVVAGLCFSHKYYYYNEKHKGFICNAENTKILLKNINGSMISKEAKNKSKYAEIVSAAFDSVGVKAYADKKFKKQAEDYILKAAPHLIDTFNSYVYKREQPPKPEAFLIGYGRVEKLLYLIDKVSGQPEPEIIYGTEVKNK